MFAPQERADAALAKHRQTRQRFRKPQVLSTQGIPGAVQSTVSTGVGWTNKSPKDVFL